MKNLLYSIFIVSIFLMSCSSDEEVTEIVDPVIGTWEGVAIQPDYGTFSISINIQNLTQGSVAGNITYGVVDLSNCNLDIFTCDNGSACNGPWTYVGKRGSVYLFFEDIPESQNCADGNIELSLIGSGELFLQMDRCAGRH